MAKKKSPPTKKKKVEELAPEETVLPEDGTLDFQEAMAALDEELIELGESPNGLIRIVDDIGHLLCMFNPVTKAIEIKPPVGRSSDKGKLFAIDVIQLSNLGVQNILREVPVSEIQAKLLGRPKEN